MVAMRRHEPALTGPYAAALLGLDGFRGLIWPMRWATSRSGPVEPGLVRTRRWSPPSDVNGVAVAGALVVLRHLGNDLRVLERAQKHDRVAPHDRVELALEHLLRLRLLSWDDLRFQGGCLPGDKMLRSIIALRGSVPPTESFGETRTAQWIRLLGWPVWRQVPIIGTTGRIVRRADFVFPFLRRRRPLVMRPELGLLMELDSREFHADAFDEDHERQSTYDALGYHWVTVTPNQVEFSPTKTRRAVEGAYQRAVGRPPGLLVPRPRARQTGNKLIVPRPIR